MIKIKRCPHCGGTASLDGNFNIRLRRFYIYVKCDVCGSQGKVFRTLKDPDESAWEDEVCTMAVEAWNMRYKEPENE